MCALRWPDNDDDDGDNNVDDDDNDNNNDDAFSYIVRYVHAYLKIILKKWHNHEYLYTWCCLKFD
jgi:hypothetical protein